MGEWAYMYTCTGHCICTIAGFLQGHQSMGLPGSTGSTSSHWESLCQNSHGKHQKLWYPPADEPRVRLCSDYVMCISPPPQEHSGRVFRLQFDDFQIISSSHDDTILVWDFLDPVAPGPMEIEQPQQATPDTPQGTQQPLGLALSDSKPDQDSASSPDSVTSKPST